MPVLSPTSRAGKRIYLSLWDVFWALISPILALYLRDPGILFHNDWTLAVNYWAFSSGFALLAFFALRLQDGMTRYFSVHEALDVAEAVLFAQLMTCGAIFTLTRLDGIPRSMPLIHGMVLLSGLFAARIFMRIAFSDRHDPKDYHSRTQRIILIGANPFAASFVQLLRAYAPETQPIIAVLDADPAMIGRAVSSAQVLGAPHELEAIITEFSIHGINTDRVVVAGETDSLSSPVLQEIKRVCGKRQIELSFLTRMIGITERSTSDATMADTRIAPEQPSVTLPSFFSVKRAIDIVGAMILLVLLSPLLLAGTLLVILDVGTPVLFWQERLGWKGHPFLIYKFRTLRAPFDEDSKPTPGMRKPSAIGRFLRATRIDELPQLLNVLLGDMSLVGPRPLLPEDQPSTKSIRLSVRPGITGWAQVNGAKLVTKEEKDKLDEWYIRNASLLFDSKILIATLELLLRTRLSATEAAADVEQVQNRNVEVQFDCSKK
jgi:lipopolysaccharide/colanic/teichoic acid biosynthesis glycosyltransferase